MISGIDSSSIAASGNLSALKKAMDSEETLMSSIIGGMQQGAQNLQTQAPSQPQPTQTSSQSVQSPNKLDIMA
ncbi:hypothetical protein [Helicobacter sp.]|uniref:hypothetical protein n=1 Tax=Helicobacter sp. TaxID=218 RepID=UPI0025B99F4D|nr:hypothetical protein [Helicobacter sp.]MCI5632922.1 hypothetical protein [Helicobacter sp.]MDY5556311.1 hypothetical protein [Helicobacter sp.]